MKKVVILVVALLAAVMVSNAQLYLSGGVGVNTVGGKTSWENTTVDKPSAFTFNLSPRVGFCLSDDFVIGLLIDFINSTEKTPDYYDTSKEPVKDKITVIGVGPFARYRLLERGDLSLFMEAFFGFGKLNSKEIDGSVTTEGDPVTAIMFQVAPILSYELSRSVFIEASCDFLGLGFASLINKSKSDANYKSTTNVFAFGLNDSFINQTFGIIGTSPVTVSIAFKF